MPQNYQVEFKQLPAELIDRDGKQPRSVSNTELDGDRLIGSLQQLGMQSPIAVMTLSTGHYKIIDGHRRFRCANLLREELAAKGGHGWETVPCAIYPELDDGEFHRIRFELQNNRRSWKPLERAVALSSIKESTGIKSNKDIADLLFISETQVSNSLKLNDQSDKYQAQMEEHGLHISYRTEFMKLRSKLRPISNFTVDEIIKIIFKKIEYKQITSAKDLRTLGRIFLRATANHSYLLEFLQNQDITAKALEQNTIQSGFSLWIEQVITKMKANDRQKMPFTNQEKTLLLELRKLLDKAFE
jgi:ParB/RepB/Spo0J family partition protein